MKATGDDMWEAMQTKMAFLERANNELSDVVYRQQQEIRVLGARLNAVLERLDAASADERPQAADDERPPHY